MDKHIRRHVLVWITVLAFTLGLIPASAAEAHFGQHLPVGGRGTAVIDGRLTSEWGDAGAVDLTIQLGGGNTRPGRLFIQNDDDNLYFALWVDVRDVAASVSFSSFVVEFDNDHDGVREEGDDVFVANPDGDYFDDYRTYLPPCPTGALCGFFDVSDDGTNDGRLVMVRTPAEVVYEVSKPLDSADDAHDFSLRAGDVVGFWMSLSVFTPTEFVDTAYPFFVPSAPGMADLRIVGPTPQDTTPPTIASSISPAPNASGWNSEPTTVSWTVADAESGVASSSGCGPTLITSDTAATATTCSATNGAGLSATSSVTVRLDATPPLVTLDGNAGTYDVDDNVQIDCTASDALSGLATPTDCGSVSGPAYTFPIGASIHERTATDLAGNTTTAAATFTVVVTTDGTCELATSFVANQGIATSLCKKLETGSYDAFRNELRALTGNAISPHDAETLLALVSAL